MLLQKTEASRVAPVFQTIRRRYPSARLFASAEGDALVALLAPLGLRKRTQAILSLRAIMAEGTLPREMDALRRLPGVGPYSAGATLTFHLGVRAPLVDANFARVYSRLFGRQTPSVPARDAWLWETADELTPTEGFQDFAYAVLDLAASTCRPRDPLCDLCPVESYCATRAAT